jgi:NADH-quinone oxidoreductase subunit J
MNLLTPNNQQKTMTGNLFYFLTFLTLFAALGVVFSRNPVYSVLSLILTFFCLSGHYILLNAQFVAAVNVIVYAGAIMVLFLFVIMFLNLNQETEQTQHRSALVKAAGVISGGLLLVLMIAVLKDADTGSYKAENFDSQIGMVENLGRLLFTKYLLPFELVSVLFLSAMVGAVMLGKKESQQRHF